MLPWHELKCSRVLLGISRLGDSCNDAGAIDWESRSALL